MKAKEIQQHDIISHEGRNVYVAFEPAITGGSIGVRGITAIDGLPVPYYTDIDCEEEVTKLNKVEPAAGPREITVEMAFSEEKEKEEVTA